MCRELAEDNICEAVSDPTHKFSLQQKFKLSSSFSIYIAKLFILPLNIILGVDYCDGHVGFCASSWVLEGLLEQVAQL